MVRLTDWLDMTLTELTGLLISKPTKEGHILFLYPPPKGRGKYCFGLDTIGVSDSVGISVDVDIS